MEKKSNSSFLINAAVGVVALVILFFLFGPEGDKTGEQSSMVEQQKAELGERKTY